MAESISCREDSLRVPGKLWHNRSFGAEEVWTVYNVDGDDSPADFTIPTPAQNLLCHRNCTLEWVVDLPPHTDEDRETFSDIWDVDGRIIAPTEDRFYELERSDGSITHTVWRDEFVVDGQTLQFDSRVKALTFVDDTYVIRASGRDGEDSDFYGYDVTGRELWHRQLPAWGFPPWGDGVGRRDHVTVDGVGASRKGSPTLDMDPQSGMLVKPISGPPEYVQPRLDWDAIENPVANVWRAEIVTVFSEDGDRIWEASFDHSEVNQAVRHDDVTLVKRTGTLDRSEFAIQAIDDDQTVRWAYTTDFDFHVESDEEYALLVLEDDGDTLEFALDHEAGELRGQVDGPETDTARAVLEEH